MFSKVYIYKYKTQLNRKLAIIVYLQYGNNDLMHKHSPNTGNIGYKDEHVILIVLPPILLG